MAGHWLFPPSSFFPFTGEGSSLALVILSRSFFLSFSFYSLPPPPSLSLSLSRRDSPVFHINTQIPWHRPGSTRVYTETTAAFHDTRPLPPPPSLIPSSLHLLRLSFSLLRPPYSSVSPPMMPRETGRGPSSGLFTSRGVHPLPLFYLFLHSFLLVSHTPSIGRATSISLSIELSRPSCTAPPDAFVDRLSLFYSSSHYIKAPSLFSLVILPCLYFLFVRCFASTSFNILL